MSSYALRSKQIFLYDKIFEVCAERLAEAERKHHKRAAAAPAAAADPWASGSNLEGYEPVYFHDDPFSYTLAQSNIQNIKNNGWEPVTYIS